MESKATAKWRGGLKEGSGAISTPSGVLSEAPYSFAQRFEGASGTNPEELLGAAHASCFSMALSAELGKARITPDEIETSATIVLEKVGDGFSITESRLQAAVTAKGGDKAQIEKCAAAAKENCPVSKLYQAKISLDLSVNV